ncbi:MAG: glycosyltransferase [bacterium]|nr:glycosyltransferase [bacterium]
MIMKNILEKLKNPKTMMTAKGKKISSVTILICTPDINSELTVKCIESVKQHTSDTLNYELLIFENGKFGSFQHPMEINRALEIARGDVLVTLDDDVEVTRGWLKSMIKLAKPDVGVVGCYQLNSQEQKKDTLRHVGGWVDGNGNVFHHTKKIKAPINVPFVGSACFLINDKNLRFSLNYKKYYQEVDLCLRSWEKGKKVVVAPHPIYHYGWGQMINLGYTREDVLDISESDKIIFKKEWIDTGRLFSIYDKIKRDLDLKIDPGSLKDWV